MKKSIIRNYLIYCLCFGFAMGIIFRVVTPFFVTFKSTGHDIVFSAMCIMAGLCVGYLSYQIGKLTLFRTIKKVSNYLSELAKGNFRNDFHIESYDEIGDLTTSLSKMVNEFRVVIKDISTGAEILEIASEEISTHAQQLSECTIKQAYMSGVALQAMEKLSDLIQQSNTNSIYTSEKVLEAKRSLSELTISSGVSISSFKEIAGKISIINEIVFQTNILSLNAAVEAARAGEHGRGFAVVASEVRKLSERSKIASKEISEISYGSFKSTTEAEALMQKLIPELDHTSELVLQIKNSNHNQSQSIHQIINSFDELNLGVQQNVSTSEELASHSEELARQAETMNKLMAHFKI